jgi:lysine 2,3-aminomutase
VVENLNWTTEFKASFKNINDLYSFLEWDLTPELRKVSETYPIFIPKNLAKKIKHEGPDGVLAKQFLPSPLEIDSKINAEGLKDPIGDNLNHKAPQLIHRYHSRVLFTPTSICPVLCRYCFRKNELSANEEIFHQDFEKTLHYLQSNAQISEIIFTGGDPLTLSNEKLSFYFSEFSKIKTIKDIRFHSRYPVILPERLDADFHEIIKKAAKDFRTITLAIHCNHVHELDDHSRDAIQALKALPLQLLSQTVLLKDVNDSTEALVELFNAFIDLKIRPYYLHHPDKVLGGMHFDLSLEEGRKIYHSLRMKLPGWAIPHYILDSAEGTGKLPAFNPESFQFSGKLIHQ